MGEENGGMLSAVFKGLVFVVTFYVALVVMMYALQRKMTYFPDTSAVTPASHGVPDMVVISVTTTDGLVLTGWFAPPATDKPVVVLFHGNAGNLANRAFKARWLLDGGYGVLLAGYRGYGGNPGVPGEDGFYADARAFLDHLTANGVEPANTVLYGESLGTGVAVQMAAEHRGQGLILESPYLSLPDVAAYHYPWVPVRLLMRDSYNSAEKIDQIDMPLLVIHGALDGTIPVTHGQALYELAREPKKLKIVAAAGHNDLHVHGGWSEISDFLGAL